jgi:hypothetical protein
MRIPVNGILLLHYHWLAPNAATISEHVQAFGRHSRFTVWTVNTALGFPSGLNELDFQVIVLHYSMFGWLPFYLSERFLRYLESSRSGYKIAFFQDECRYWPQRVDLIERCGVRCVYTLVEPTQFDATYGRYTSAPRLIYTLPGYVSDDLVQLAHRLGKPSAERTIDVGYRGRQLPPIYGRGSQEKHWIGVRFRELAAGVGLRLDIESEEEKRLYGDSYYEFLANCRAVLGVEAGVSIFDIDDQVWRAYARLRKGRPRLTFEEAQAELLWRFEDNIYYRTISPRHFEAAALRVCQILFEGKYSGIMEPMVHYIPLRKDFSNFDEVIRRFRDAGLREQLTESAYRDLIASGRYSYQHFIEGFDQELLAAGMSPGIPAGQVEEVTRLLDRGRAYRQFRTRITSLRYRPFPGRKYVRMVAKPVLTRLRHLRQERS